MVNSYEDLIVWQKAMTMTEEKYRLTRLLPKEETFSLKDQMRGGSSISSFEYSRGVWSKESERVSSLSTDSTWFCNGVGNSTENMCARGLS